MDPLIRLLVACAVVLLAVLWRAQAPRVRRDLPFTRRASLLTASKLRFHKVLLRVAPPGVAVYVKVRLMDVVTVPESAWRQDGAPASGMHLDFVLADVVSMKPLMVIELDDKSHRLPEARERDVRKAAALASAGLPLLRVPVVGRYDERELREGAGGGGGVGISRRF